MHSQVRAMNLPTLGRLLVSGHRYLLLEALGSVAFPLFSLWLESGGSTRIISLAGLSRQEVRKQELSVSPLELFQQLWFPRKLSFPRASFRRRERPVALVMNFVLRADMAASSCVYVQIFLCANDLGISIAQNPLGMCSPTFSGFGRTPRP